MATSTRATTRQTLRGSTVRDTILRGAGGGTPPIVVPDRALVDRDGDPIVDRNGAYILTRVAPTEWTYATLAAAESSGDAWVEGDTIQITGGAAFFYRAALAVDGYSGLIHKYKWDGTGALGTTGAVDVRASTEKNVDPDTWAGFTKTANNGGAADVNGGRSRLLAPFETTSSWVRMTESGGLSASDNDSFLILDKATAGFTDAGASNNQTVVEIPIVCAVDGSNTKYFLLRRQWNYGSWRTASTSNGNQNTGKTTNVERRIWLYVREDRGAIWFDDEATPNYAFALPYSGADLSAITYLDVEGNTYLSNNYLKLAQALTGIAETTT